MKKTLSKIANDYIKNGWLRKGERIVDVNPDTEPIYGQYLVYVTVITKFHTVIRYSLWIYKDNLEVEENSCDSHILM